MSVTGPRARAGGLDLEHRPSYFDLLARPDLSSTAGQAWLVIFTDLMAMMLAFFVLLFSMSQIEQQKWQGLVEALSSDLNALPNVANSKPAVEYQPEQEAVVPGADLDYLTPVIREQIATHPLLARATVHRAAERLGISLPAGLLFGAGAPGRGARLGARQRATQPQQLCRGRDAPRGRRLGARVTARLGADPGSGRGIHRNFDPCRLCRPDRRSRYRRHRSGGRPE